jgi:hypothetical protein
MFASSAHTTSIVFTLCGTASAELGNQPCHTLSMSKMLESVIAKVRKLPQNLQDSFLRLPGSAARQIGRLGHYSPFYLHFSLDSTAALKETALVSAAAML